VSPQLPASQDSQKPAPQEKPAVVIPAEVLSELPPQVQAQVQQQILTISAQQWSGPLPPPEALEKYDKVIPGSAARLLQLTEKEQVHRHTMDQNVLATKAGDVKRGQYLGFLIGGAAVVGAIAVASFAPWVSVALVGVPVASIVNAIVKGRKS
jgi:uncharacterized membrane protein